MPKAVTVIAVCATVFAAITTEGSAALATVSAVAGLLGLAYAAGTAPVAPVRGANPDYVDDFVEKFQSGRGWETLIPEGEPHVHLKEGNSEALCIKKGDLFKGACVFFIGPTRLIIAKGYSRPISVEEDLERWCRERILPLPSGGLS